MTLYFCFKQEMGEVEALAEKYFERADNPKIRTPEELAGFHNWRTPQEMDGLRRRFMLSEHLGICVPDSGDYKTFLRVYEETLERMLEGPGATRAIEQAKEMYEGHTISIGRQGDELFVRAKSAMTPHHIREFLRGGVVPIVWPTSNSPFTKFMNDLWEGGWAVYDEKSNARPDMTYAIVGDKVPEPEKLRIAERIVYVPSAWDLLEPLPRGGGGGFVEIPAEELIQEHDEDGKPVGEPYDPNEPGGEDQPFHLSGHPTVSDSAVSQARAESTPYIELGGGYYAHSSGVHTGEATARACGVDLSRFTDDSMDGL